MWVALLALLPNGCNRRDVATPRPTASPGGEPELALVANQNIAGRVLTREGEGFAGIGFVAVSELSNTGAGTGISDEDGAFRIEGLTEGLHTVVAHSAGHDLAQREHIAAGTTDLVFTLVESARVSGRVLDPSGRPLKSFLVAVRADEVDLFSGSVVARKTIHHSTDGAFEIGGLPEGDLFVEARAESFAPSFSDPFRTLGDSTTKDVVVRMTQGGSLVGLVLEASSGLPIAGAEVFPVEHSWLYVGTGVGSERVRVPRWDVPTSLPRAVVRTDASGRFALAHMTAGRHRLRIQAGGFASVVTGEVPVEEQDAAELPPQRLVVGATITGIVLAVDGKIAPGALLQLTLTESDHSCDNRLARADSSGRFMLENVLPSTYRLSATRANPGHDPFEAIGDIRRSEIEIQVSDSIRYEIELNMGERR